jgi:hypothetical protein
MNYKETHTNKYPCDLHLHLVNKNHKNNIFFKPTINKKNSGHAAMKTINI